MFLIHLFAFVTIVDSTTMKVLFFFFFYMSAVYVQESPYRIYLKIDCRVNFTVPNCFFIVVILFYIMQIIIFKRCSENAKL